jgi:Cytochrome C oxidase subunit II, periplasmic domain/Cupredoxin-like domain
MKVEKEELPQVVIKVEGFQWEWTFLYMNEGIFVAGQTLVRPALMVLPVDEPVEIQLTSRDVIHSFFVPDLLFKRDAIPGRTSTFTFTPEKLGTFPAQCAEFCGLWHSRMTFSVQVVSPPDYQTWIMEQRKHAQGIDCDPNGTSLSLVAHDIAWDTNCLAVPPNQPFTVSVTNQDQGIQHNFSIYNSFFEEKTFFKSPKITGPASETLDVTGLPAGHYYFQCDVHGPAMSGAFVVK